MPEERVRICLRYLAITAAYAACFAALRSISSVQWMLTSGLRFSCLLLVPYRYWPALVLGDLIPSAYLGYECLAQFGPVWAVCMSIPLIVLVMPVAWWFREKMGLFPSRRHISMGMLMLMAVLASVVWATGEFATLSAARFSFGMPTVDPGWLHAAGYLVGNYLGILTVAPLALMVRLAMRGQSVGACLRHLADNALMHDTVLLLLPTVALFAWIGDKGSVDVKQISKIAMFLPVAWLVLKHGWRGAALGGTAVIGSICWILPEYPVANMLSAQAFMAFVITCLLVLGARITEQGEQEYRGRRNDKLAIQLAQQGFYLNEVRMRQIAQALEQIGASVQQSHNRLLDRIKHLLPGTEERSYYRQAAITQQQVYRLIDNLYPRVWQKRGLPAALREGAIAQAMDELRVDYRCEVTARDLDHLDPGVHMSVYRLACEMLAHLFAQRRYARLRLVLRDGETHGRHWVVLRVEGKADAGAEKPAMTRDALDLLLSRLGASGLGLDAIHDHASIYNGDLHTRSGDDWARLTVLLHDPQTPQLDFAVPPPPSLRLVVG